MCDNCAEKRNRAGRARNARLREAGLPRRDRERARAWERERWRRQADARREAGICVGCGRAPAMPERPMCESCLDKRRAADRARYAEASARGAAYGGKNPEVKRRIARVASKKRQEARHEAGLCVRCGQRTPIEGSTT